MSMRRNQNILRRLAIVPVFGVVSLIAACGSNSSGAPAPSTPTSSASAVESSTQVLSSSAASGETLGGDISDGETSSSATASVEQTSSDPALAKILEQGYITVGTSGNNPPTIMQGDGGLVGIDADWAHIIADSLGVDLKFQTVKFAGLITGLQTHVFDLVMSGFRVDADRAKVIDFSVPFAEDSVVLVYKKGVLDDSLSPEEGIKGHSICVSTGSSNGDEPASKWGGYSAINRYPATPDAFLALQHGSCEAVVTGRLLALSWIQKDGGPDYTTSTKDANHAYIAAGIAKDQPGLKAAVDAAIKAASESGKCQDIAQKWTGKAFSDAACAGQAPADYPAAP
jgi:ABC-type amino acid transport substrate-binding protein